MKNQSIYKYLERRHTEMMMNEGRIRIGTLFDYRKVEEYDMQRADTNEGKMVFVYDIEKEINVSELPEIFAGIHSLFTAMPLQIRTFATLF